MDGNSGQNQVAGTNSSDDLTGTSGADILNGMAGDDVLNGGAGADIYDGSSGSDRYILSDTDAVDTLFFQNSGSEQDVLDISSLLPDSGVNASNLKQFVKINAAGVYLDSTGSGQFSTENQIARFAASNPPLNAMVAVQVADTSVLHFDWTETGNIPLLDTPAQTGEEGAGLNEVSGTHLGDTLQGTNGNDALYGSWGDDVISGGAGADLYVGGAGSDRYVLDYTESVATLDFKSTTFEKDVLDVSQLLPGVTADNLDNHLMVTDGGVYLDVAGEGNFTDEQKIAEFTEDSIFSNNEIRIQLAGNTQVTFNVISRAGVYLDAGESFQTSEVLAGRIEKFNPRGEDEVYGSGPDSTINTGFLRSQAGEKFHFKLDESDVREAFGGKADEMVDGSSVEGTGVAKDDDVADHRLWGYGKEGKDTLIGNEEGAYLDGGVGDDRVESGSGRNMVIGGAGEDEFALTLETSTDSDLRSDLLYDYTSIEGHRDLLDLQGILPAEATAANIHSYVKVTDAGVYVDITGTATFVAANQLVRWGEKVEFDNLINLRLADGSEIQLNRDEALSEFDGGDGNDQLKAGEGSDILRGMGGDDVLDGDALSQTKSADYLYGGDGNDKLHVDKLDLEDGVVDGGAGYDTIRLKEDAGESVTMDLRASNVEKAFGSASDDVIDGSGYTDTAGGYNRDTGDYETVEAQRLSLYGRDGEDTLTGGVGRDYLDGGTGDDTISGGQGRDLLAGGSGNDVFVLADDNEIDTIWDFKSTGDETDSLDISAFIGDDFDYENLAEYLYIDDNYIYFDKTGQGQFTYDEVIAKFGGGSSITSALTISLGETTVIAGVNEAPRVATAPDITGETSGSVVEDSSVVTFSSATGTHQGNSNRMASNLIDGDDAEGDYWSFPASVVSEQPAATLVLDGSQTLNMLHLNFEQDSNQASYRPDQIKVEYQDNNGNWVDHGTYDTTASEINTLSFAEVTTGEIRLTMIGNSASPNGNIAINQVTANLGAFGQLNASDQDAGDTASFISLTAEAGQYGTLSLTSDGQWTYLLDDSLTQALAEGQTDTETFTVTAIDNDGLTTTQNLTVTVNGRNDAPTATENTVTLVEDQSRSFALSEFGFSDIDTGDTVQSVTIAQLPAAGILTLSGSAVTANQVITTADIPNLVFTPEANGDGAGYADFKYTVSDGTASSSVQTLTFDVTSVNDNPVLEIPISSAPDVRIYFEASEVKSFGDLESSGWNLYENTTSGGTDIQATTLTDVDTESHGGNMEYLSLDGNDATAEAFLIQDYQGNSALNLPTMYYNFTDAEMAAFKDSGFKVSMTVMNSGTNNISLGEPPSADSNNRFGFENGIPDDNQFHDIVIQAHFTEDDALVIDSYTVDGNDATYVLANDGRNENFDDFTLSFGASSSASTTVDNSMLVQSVKMEILPSDFYIFEKDAFDLSLPVGAFSDIEDDQLTYSLKEGSPDWLTINSETGIMTGTPANGDVGAQTVTVVATDSGNASAENSFVINVQNVNDAPTAISLDSTEVLENSAGAVVGTLNTTDVDVNDTHSYTISDNRFEVVAGQVKLKDGVSLDAETESPLTLSVTATDSGGESVSEDFTLTVTSVNEAPVIDGLTTESVFADSSEVTFSSATGTHQGNSNRMASNLIDGDDAEGDYWSFPASVVSEQPAATLVLDGRQTLNMLNVNFEVDGNQVPFRPEQIKVEYQNSSGSWIDHGTYDTTASEINTLSFAQVTTTEIRLTMIGNGDSPNGNIAINQVTANLGAIGQLSVSDPDAGDTASFVSMTDAVGDYGTLNLSSDGSWTYVLDDSLTQVLTEDQVETESFTITAVDSQGETSTQNLSVTVNGPNNVPDVAGGDGDDTLLGTDGADLILGGAGNDILTGGAGSDVFDFNTADLGTGAVPTEDVITDFQAGQGGDVVDLRDILVDDSDPLDNYLSLNFENGDTTIEVKPSGDNDITQKIKLEGVDLTGYGGGVTDADILNNLIDEGNLQID